MNRRWVLPSILLAGTLGAVANAQAGQPVAITTPAIVLTFPSPAPVKAAAGTASVVAVTTAAIVLTFPSPAPLHGATASVPVSITTAAITLTFPSPSPLTKK